MQKIIGRKPVLEALNSGKEIDRIILSKIDETTDYGFFIELAEAWNKPFAFLTNGQGVNVVLEFVGSARSLEWSLPSLGPGGCLVLVGYSPGDPWLVDTVPFHFHEWHAIGCRASTKKELSEVIGLVEAKKIKPVVNKTYPLFQANEALEELRKGDVVGRIVLVQD